MKRIYFTLMALIFSAHVASAQTTNRPIIYCENPTYDFGISESSESITHTFTIQNKGDLSLTISRVRPACGCTVATLSDKTVAPGKSVTIETTLSLKGRKGAQRKTIRVESNDPENSTYTLTLEGQVASNMSMSPSQVYFGQVNPSEVKTEVVDVAFAQPTSIKTVETSNPMIRAELETIEDGKHYSVKVSTVPPLKVEAFSTLVILRAENGKTYSLPVAGNVVGPLLVAPKEFLIRSKNAGPVVRYAVVRPGEVQQFSVTGVETPNGDIAPEVSRIGKDGYRLQLSNIVANEALNGKEVIIYTDAAGMEEIRIPFRVVP